MAAATEWEGEARSILDGNGIADLPHRELDVFGDLRRPFPVLSGLIAGGPGERLLADSSTRASPCPARRESLDPGPIVTGGSM